MLTKYKDVRPKMRHKKPFEKCFHVCGVFRNFFREGAPNFDILSNLGFSGSIILKHIKNEKSSGGSGSMLPRKIFENLHTVVAILVLFEQFLSKFYLNFLPLNLSVSPNMMHFVRTFSIMRA